MDNRTNKSLILVEPYTNIFVYSAVTLLQFCAVILNGLFIYIAPKDKNRQTNKTIIIVCVTQIGQAVVTFGKSTFIFGCNDIETVLRWFPAFDALDFFVKISFMWSSILLSAARIVVIINMDNNQSNIIGKTESKYSIRKWLPYVIAFLLSVAYGLLKCHNISQSIPNFLATYILKLTLFGISWIVFSALVLVTFCLLVKFVYMRNIQTTPQYQGQTNITGRLIQQVLYSLLFHVGFIVIPYTYIVVINILPINQTSMSIIENQENLYCLVEAILPMFSPISLGIFLKEQRKKIASFLKIQGLANRSLFGVRVEPGRNEHLETIHEAEVLGIVNENCEDNISIDQAEFGINFIDTTCDKLHRNSPLSLIQTGQHVDLHSFSVCSINKEIDTKPDETHEYRQSAKASLGKLSICSIKTTIPPKNDLDDATLASNSKQHSDTNTTDLPAISEKFGSKPRRESNCSQFTTYSSQRSIYVSRTRSSMESFKSHFSLTSSNRSFNNCSSNDSHFCQSVASNYSIQSIQSIQDTIMYF